VNRSIENANRVTPGLLARGALFGLVALLAACSQGPGGGGIGLASGQDPDPATVDFPIFYLRHPIPEEQDDLERKRPYVEDEEYSVTLWKRDRASPGAPETEITARLRAEPLGAEEDRYDIKDLAVSPDGLKVAFAMRGPLDEADDEDEPPNWNIWEYDIATDVLRRVFTSDIAAGEGQDVAPAYLPDGRIVFSSTRQRQSKATLIDEGKGQFEAANESRTESAFMLHVVNADGTDPHQISFNPSGDFDATVLQDGRLLFTRWDNAPGRDGMHLYTSNPDGTDTQLLYGALSHATGSPVDPLTGETPDIEFTRPREMSDGRLMVLTRERTDVDFGGNLVIVDARNFVENTQPLAGNGATGNAQTPATLNDVRTIPGPSPGGRFQSGFPLWDGSGRILVSWSQCRLLDVGGADPTRIVPCTSAAIEDPAVETAPPLYSIWMFTPAQNTILPVMAPVEGVMITEAVAAQPRNPLPAVIVDKKPPAVDQDLVSEAVGILAIRSVYDIMGTDQARLANGTTSTIDAVSNPTNAAYAQRQVRFVRIEKPVSLPDDDDIADPDNSAFGPTGLMREIVAYAPVEPDGSVRMKVPGNIPFQISLLDVNGRRVGPIHSSWLSLRPGEVLECNGCHTRNVPANTTVRSHGRRGSFDSVYAGSTGTNFPGANPGISAPEAGSTMAAARSSNLSSCVDSTTMVDLCGPQSTNASADVVYNEIWIPGAPPTASFIYGHRNLTTAPPTNAYCYPTWQATCRITIHYATIGTRLGHIHPLWSAVRQASALPGAPTGIDTNDDNVLEETYTCTSCHSRTDVLNQVQLPKASLELTDGVSNDDPLQEAAYRFFLFGRPELELDVNGNVVIRQVPVLDEDGNQVLDDAGNPVFEPSTLPASMAAGNARGSRFFNVMNSPTHQGMLTPAELRLISEWLDIGAQYYNDPFLPTPQN